MKVIKTLVTLSIINALVVVGVVASRGKSGTILVRPSPSGYATGLSIDMMQRSANPSALPSSPEPVDSVVQTASTPPRPTAPTPILTTPTTAPTPTPTPLPTPTPISGCIVRIDGVSYNVEQLRMTHSGGDIFECGSDMSAIFWREHNNKILQKMQRYKI